jgi:glycosyltransferase involved in cell wall biosynthesis
VPGPAVSFAVVVPMYNEEVGAEACVRALAASLRGFAERSLLIVVEDGSADRTSEMLAAVAPRFDNVLVVHHPRNQGYGAALRTGGREAAGRGFDYVVFMDSDLTNDPKYLPLFVDKMRQGFDLIKASRYMRGGGVDGVPWWRVWISRLGNALACRLYGLPLHDCTNGFRALRSGLFASLPLAENRFPIIMEELYHAARRGWTVAEVPNRLTSRGAEQRPTSFSYRPSTFYRYLKYPCRARLDRFRRRRQTSEEAR